MRVSVNSTFSIFFLPLALYSRLNDKLKIFSGVVIASVFVKSQRHHSLYACIRPHYPHACDVVIVQIIPYRRMKKKPKKTTTRTKKKLSRIESANESKPNQTMNTRSAIRDEVLQLDTHTNTASVFI